MKSLFIISAALFFLVSVGKSQSCLLSGITFSTQIEIDNFQSNYPNCTVIEGDVTIEGDNIINLNGLSTLTVIEGQLLVKNNNLLASLNGLNNLNSVGGKFLIIGNDSLDSFGGFENLVTVGGNFGIILNHSLTNLIGFENLNSIEGQFLIQENQILINLFGLENLNSIQGSFRINNNYSITSLSGTENIDPESISFVSIFDNPNLSNCAIKSVCEHLINLGNSYIDDNPLGCSSEEQIIGACITSSKNVPKNLADEIIIYPNPTKDFFTVENFNEFSIKEINLVNQTGQIIKQYELDNQSYDISSLAKGIYFLEIKMNDQMIFKKLIIQ